MTDNDPTPATRESTTASARQRAIEAYDGARDRVSDTLGEAPLIALAGGIAAGALIAALLPRTLEIVEHISIVVPHVPPGVAVHLGPCPAGLLGSRHSSSLPHARPADPPRAPDAISGS